MKNTEIYYFEQISNRLSHTPVNGCRDIQTFTPHVMASQFSYIYNLQTKLYEEVKGLKKVLGYSEDELTLEFFYNLIHPEDRKFFFEAARNAIEHVNREKLFSPEDCQLTILYRILKKDGKYAQIHQQTMVKKVLNEKLYKTYSLCNDVTHLNLKRKCSAYLKAPGFTINENFDVLNSNNNCLNNLSPREKCIIMLLSAGYNSKEISRKLNLSLSTIYTHRRNILKKTGIKNIVEIINAYT